MRRQPSATRTDTLFTDTMPFRCHRAWRDGRARTGAKPGAGYRRQGRGARGCARLPRRPRRRRFIEGYAMRLLTGNDLKTGAVIWWTGRDWSVHIEDAGDAGEHGEALLAAEEGDRRVNGGYMIAAVGTQQGPRPGHLTERTPTRGPTVRT